MKIQFTPKRIKLVRLAIALIAISMAGYVVYAATLVSVSNTVTITVANGIGVSITTTSPGTCPALGSISYQTVDFSNPNPWTIPAGGNSAQFFCLENTGTGSDLTPSITMSSTTITGLTVATTPATIPAIAPGTVSAPVTVTVSAPASATGTGTFALAVK
jgi:hypothetical protein